MDCRDILDILGAGGPLGAEARAHAATCAQCTALVHATDWTGDPQLSPGAQEKAVRIATADLGPVRPASPLRYSLLFWCCAAIVAVVGVLIMGGHGWRAASTLQKLWLAPGLLVLAAATPVVLSRLMIPGSLLRIRPAYLLAIMTGWFALAAPVLYPARMYAGFGHSAMGCLAIGLGFAAVVAAGSWLILRRGFVTAPGIAAVMAGALAGTTSLTLQIIYCPHLDAGHYTLAHFASFLLSILLAGAVYARGSRGH